MKTFKYKRSYHQEQIDSKALDIMLLKHLWHILKRYRIWVYLAIFFLIISKGIEAYVPIAIGTVSHKILDSFKSSIEAKQLLIKYVLDSCLGIILLLFIGYLLDSINVVLKSLVSQKALLNLRTKVYQHIEHLPLYYYDRHSVGRLMTRTIHDVDQINQLFAESIIPLIGSAFLFLGISVGMVAVDWRLACFIAIVLVLAWWLTSHFRYYQRRCYEMIRSIVSAMNTFVQEQLMGASTIRNFGLAKREREIFEEINTDHCNAYIDSIHNFAFFIAGIDVLQSVSLIIVFALLVLFAPHQEGFQVSTFFTFSLYALMFFRPLADLAERYNVLQSAMAASERIFNLLDEPTEVNETPSSAASLLNTVESIEFENVWFAYEKENWVLRGLSFQVKKGESIALVGMTGAGKTSIMSLLLRFYEFQRGSIKINGLSIRDYSLSHLRQMFSVVLQDPVIFTGTIAENITLYNPDFGKEKITKALDFLNLHAFINRFPLGIEQPLTERGKSLSSGEMQLISMARAVTYNRTVLILDEATANIDAPTEKIIQQALEKMLGEKTSLVVAHRLTTIQHVHRILVLHKGILVESGTHQQLMEKKGVYEKLYRLQVF